ncbi:MULTISPECIES: thiamine pyrophosphate-dependent enzyme [Dethiosulfovibrio]|uniref:Indolepyruvate oxidoreductase subunit IorA n=2 Tax=Dethiosulfovibrio TaxID=47054 RepID=A0ABS9ENJ2_9BACT|nr:MULTISPECIES: thiamine pyrophosphate-dependent enzyme [Dethiosulfovibrio]MCF4113746.1 indolepyruvate ferredoxin oxidoreductase subunit alpha [Dethiosulfovibrio russensis]MCF4141841.1 indolepyruvate ferredoxin oxidoreductase subunit alpha [Dethiosulfovibrio marinus]MCF4143741.1 indolepyruvate ferredoxin oxidoreductase subunit alpha [Dethiosulfovibrio acidaminovorans]
MSERRILLGNEAIARGVVESGCAVATAYPGTPSSEILPAIAAYSDEMGTNTQVEWGANEKVALEMAIGACYAGKRSCAVMKQVGLNVAADPFMSVAHQKLDGGLLVVVSDDPGCHASQDDQDSRAYAAAAKIPCFDPSDAREAKAMVADAFDLAGRYGVMAMLRPTVRVDHCRQDVEIMDDVVSQRDAVFDRKPAGKRIVMPAVIHGFLDDHSDRFEAIRGEFGAMDRYNFEVPSEEPAKLGVIACGISYSVVRDILNRLGRKDVSILKIGTPVPLPVNLVEDFVDRHDRVLVLEETQPVVEGQILNRTAVMGRWNGWVPKTGELVPEVVESVLLRVLGVEEDLSEREVFNKIEEELSPEKRRPRLCPGCSHRPAYFSIRKVFPDAVVASDIGCYGLAIAQNAVDTNICMGGSVTAASGIYLAFKADGKGADRPIFATLGDSTFFHSGMTGLATAVYNRHAFVLVILDNRITAMTGGQDHPGTGDKMRSGEEGVSVSIEEAVKGCGVKWLSVLDPYDIEKNEKTIEKAWEYASSNGEPAVIVFRHPCITMLKVKPEYRPVKVDPSVCIGCGICIRDFNCPGLVWDQTTGKAMVDDRYCVNCGVCVAVCPKGAIVSEGGDR